jgi:MFS family permease
MRAGGTAGAVLAVVFLLNLLGRGAGETYAVFLLPLEREFGWARSQLTSVYSAYLLVGGFIAPLVGLVFDRLGPRSSTPQACCLFRPRSSSPPRSATCGSSTSSSAG